MVTHCGGHNGDYCCGVVMSEKGASSPGGILRGEGSK